jgi:hypothetical protein
MFILQKQ